MSTDLVAGPADSSPPLAGSRPASDDATARPAPVDDGGEGEGGATVVDIPLRVRVPTGPEALAAFLDRLGYDFEDPDLLRLALTHRSYCAEHAGEHSNERLEFLGDAVLGLVVTDHIFRAYPEMPEGELAKLRSSVVSAPTLAEVARELDLGPALRLGKGESASGGSNKASILADAFEAVLGAVYLDGGMAAVQPLLCTLLDERILAAAVGPGGHDFKTRLQELAARHFEELPVYELRDEGPDHEKRFFATVHLGGEPQGDGEGRTKKQAEQSAAHAAWGRLARRFDDAPETAGVPAAGAGLGAPQGGVDA